MSHRSTQPRTPASGSRDIVCVEWTEPVSVGWLVAADLRTTDWCPPLSDGHPAVYVVEDAAGPIYVGATRQPVKYRLINHISGHFAPLRRTIAAAVRGDIYLSCHWAYVDAARLFKLEHQVIAALQPKYNRLGNHRWRNVPALPDRMVA